jgi:hypothetical protein
MAAWRLVTCRKPKGQGISAFCFSGIEDESVGCWVLAESENNQHFSESEGRWLLGKSESNHWYSGLYEE